MKGNTEKKQTAELEDLYDVVNVALEPLKLFIAKMAEPDSLIAGALLDQAEARISEAFDIVDRDLGRVKFDWESDSCTTTTGCRLIKALLIERSQRPATPVAFVLVSAGAQG